MCIVFFIIHILENMFMPNHDIMLEQRPLKTWMRSILCRSQIIEYSMQILELINKSIPLVKVVWANPTSLEATWETEEDMRIRNLCWFEQPQDFFKTTSKASSTNMTCFWLLSCDCHYYKVDYMLCFLSYGLLFVLWDLTIFWLE